MGAHVSKESPQEDSRRREYMTVATSGDPIAPIVARPSVIPIVRRDKDDDAGFPPCWCVANVSSKPGSPAPGS